jgi:hypothetical protein
LFIIGRLDTGSKSLAPSTIHHSPSFLFGAHAQKKKKRLIVYRQYYFVNGARRAHPLYPG